MHWTGRAAPRSVGRRGDRRAAVRPVDAGQPAAAVADDAAACLAALIDGTADAVATDHAPHTVVDKAVEFGLAANGISGIETALGLLLAAVDAGRLPLAVALAALTSGPAAVLGSRLGARAERVGLVEGAPADLVVFDRSDTWTVEADTLASRGKNSPLIGRALPGRVLDHAGRWPPRLRGPVAHGLTHLRAPEIDGPRSPRRRGTRD